MNDTAQIILSIATLFTSIGAVIASLRNHVTIKEVQKQTNGLMALKALADEAKGNLQGRADAASDQAHFDAGKSEQDPVNVKIVGLPSDTTIPKK